jgi:hypothetical protein
METHPIYEYFRRRYQERFPDFPWDLDDKAKGKTFARGRGIPTPETLQTIEDPSQLNDLRFPSRAVVKPNGLHSGRGMFALVRVQDGFVDLYARRSTTRERVLATYRENWKTWAKHNRRIPLTILVEQFAESPLGTWSIPLDVKIYFVAGSPRFIVVINRNFPEPRFGFFTPDWKDAQDMIQDVSVRVTQERPKRPESNLAYATKLAQGLDTPFVSVDMLDADPEPWFGEFTPAPGGPFAWSLGLSGMWKFKDQVLDTWFDAWISWSSVSSPSPDPSNGRK